MKPRLALVFAAVSIIGCTPSDTSSASSGVPVGTQVSIPDSTFLGATRDDYHDLVDLSVAKDSDGVRRMVERGEAIWLPNGATGKVLENRLLLVKLRITDGPYSGQSGWVSRELLE